jgi:epoxyqueuosine reductase
MTARPETDLTKLIKNKSLELGLDLCGIALPRVLDKNRELLEKWCDAGMNDKMEYLKRNAGKRSDPREHLPDVKSMIVTGMSYNTGNLQKRNDVPIISRYAYGSRYQEVITAKLKKLLGFIKTYNDQASGKIVVDSAPIFEKQWAVEAGLGWQGKHSIIINKDIGSFFFIGILILNIELDFDAPAATDLCGNCRACIDRCPTGAINENRTIDTRKCISNLTIENRAPLAEEIGPKLENRVFACDICQEICPWNRKARVINHPEYAIKEEVADMTPEEWTSLSEEKFNRLFGNSSISRAGYAKFIHNIKLVMKS